MTLFLSRDALARRKRDLQHPDALGGLAASLSRELHAALDVPVPDGKSRLTRTGGRCPSCTVLLEFDPRQPNAHRCPSCGTVHHDRVHHEWWLMNAHLWTAEQCTRAAALAFLLDDDRAARRADDILHAYTERYAGWPNRDNALGPTRPFFSTYLESIWLLHLATALDLRIAAVGARYGDTLDRVIAPSAALISSFGEGRSNRQVWHSAALFAAAGLLDDRSLRNAAGASLLALLRDGLHGDGSWYEGENYHLFAHRGLLSAVTLAERSGVELPPPLLERFEAGFAVPFRTILPDGTFPSRRDSQYGVTLRQYRTADWVECGLARHDTPALRAALATLYDRDVEPGDTGRATSTADAERNQRAVRLTRSDCNWRALLLARLELPPLHDAVPRSELLEGQGLAVFRRQRGRFWVALDYGDPGDGHGHPDRLNLVIATPDARWLDDVGTGSYTSPTLAWYRSSMAHNAPMVDGHDQGAARGTLLAHDEHGEAGWVSAAFVDPVSGVRFVRTVVVLENHVVDELTWASAHDVTIDVPMQAQLVEPAAGAWSTYDPGVAGSAMLTEPAAMPWPAGTTDALLLRPLPSPATDRREAGHSPFRCALWSDADATLWRADTIGPPAGAAHGLVSLRQRGTSGRSVRIFAADTGLSACAIDGADVTVGRVASGGPRYAHSRTAGGWTVVTTDAAGTVTRCELRGLRAPPEPPPGATAGAARDGRVERFAVPVVDGTGPSIVTALTLGESAWRATEESWASAGSPTAQVGFMVWRDAPTVRFRATVQLDRPAVFAPAVAENPLDNELADVNSDGVQFHWRSFISGDWNSVIAVPDGDVVRLTVTSGEADGITASCVDDGARRGYTVYFDLPWPGLGTLVEWDCVINERPADRERRRGQLVASGAHGESAYLRGARQSPARALRFVFDPAPP